jgi:2-aminobenzoate-CoA ligase
MTRSAHVDAFTANNLPPPEQWPELVFDLPELAYPEQLNCAERLLDGTARRFGVGRRCLISEGQVWTYGETLEKVDGIAHVLVEDLGIVPGNRVLLRGPNNAWYAAAWLAVIKAGAVAVATMPLYRAAELTAIIDKAEITTALCDHRYVDALVETGRDLDIVAWGGPGPDDLSRRIVSKAIRFDAVQTAADDVCLIAFTSGTTGQPKGCMHFHRDVLAIADTFSKRLIKPVPDDVFTGSPPLAFTYGLGQLLVFPLRAGAAALLLEDGSPPHLTEAIAEHGATIVGTAPTAYRAMLDVEGWNPTSLRRCVSAGETLPKPTFEAFREHTGIELIDGIGATEMLHVFISASDDDIRPGATGVPVPGYEARVTDDDGRPVRNGVVGRLTVRGPTGCRYLADPRQTEYVQHGWNVTGDAYVRDEDGYFWYQARTDDMIISAGYNIAGPEVEAALLSHTDVAEAGVVGVPDDARGEVVKAYVVVRKGVDATEDLATRLQEHVKGMIAPYKYPRQIEFIDELPRTQTGKVQRFRLRQLT